MYYAYAYNRYLKHANRFLIPPFLLCVYMCVSVIFTISCQHHKLLTADGACFLTGRDAQGRAEGDLKHVRDQKFVKRLMVGKNAPACPWNFVVVIWWPAQVTTFLLIKIQLNDCENQVKRLILQFNYKLFRLKNVRRALQQKGAMKYWIGTLVWLPAILEWY